MALKKLCRCGKIIDYADKYCEECSPIVEQQQKQKHKDYKKYRTDKDIQKIYTDGRWLKVKDIVKRHQHGLDLYSYYVLEQIEYAYLYHHVVETKDDIARAYDVANVIGLTEANHRMIHSKYNKSDRDKKQMQELLFGLLERWNKEFGTSN